MTLTDTGPLVALTNRNDPNYGACVEATQRLPAGPLVTTCRTAGLLAFACT